MLDRAELERSTERIEAHKDVCGALSDEAIRDKTGELRTKLTEGYAIDDVLPEAFALVREAAQRVLGIWFHSGQLLAGTAVHRRALAQLPYGEGKTFAIALPAYLNALAGQVHVIALDDHTARCAWKATEPLYRFLGISSVQLSNSSKENMRSAADRSEFPDVTYGSIAEFIKEYLRTHWRDWDRGSVSSYFGIVDDAEFVLVDLSVLAASIGDPRDPDSGTRRLLKKCSRLAGELSEGQDYLITDDERLVLTEDGTRKAMKRLGLVGLNEPWSLQTIEPLMRIEMAIRARHITRDHQYIVAQQQVIPLDPLTGRAQVERRFESGLHEALGAKEDVATSAFTTHDRMYCYHFLQRYSAVGGVGSSLETVADEIRRIHGLDVLPISANWAPQLKILPATICPTKESMLEAIAEEIRSLRNSGRPVLVSASTTRESQDLSELLRRRRVRHDVINATRAGKEDEYLAAAGERGKVTVTALLPVGVDIDLGEGIGALGGLHVISSNRHLSARCERLALARAGGRGRPGSAHSFLSPETEVLRDEGDSVVAQLHRVHGSEGGDVLGAENTIEEIRQRIEARRAAQTARLISRNRLVALQQDAVIALGDELVDMGMSELKTYVREVISDYVDRLLAEAAPPDLAPGQWDLQRIENALESLQLPDRIGEPFRESRSQIAEEIRNRFEEQLINDTERIGKFAKLLAWALDKNWPVLLQGLGDLLSGHNDGAPVNGQERTTELKRAAAGMLNAYLHRATDECLVYIMHAPRRQAR